MKLIHFLHHTAFLYKLTESYRHVTDMSSIKFRKDKTNDNIYQRDFIGKLRWT
jgi:hypothetical protein